MRLNRLQLENFKACRRMDLDLAPLTVLIGANNAGKSSVLHSIALQAQSAPTGAVGTIGPLVDLGPAVAALVNTERGSSPAFIDLSWAGVDRQPPAATHGLTIGVSGDPSSRMAVELPESAGGQAVVDASDDGISVHLPGQSPTRLQASKSLWSVGQVLSDGATVGVQAAVEQALPYLQRFVRGALSRFRYVGANRHVESSTFLLGDRPVANPRTAQELVDTLAYNEELVERVSERCAAIFGYGVDRDLVPNRQITLVAKSPSGRRNVVNLGTGFIQTVWLLGQLELALDQAPTEPWSITPLVGVEEPELHIHPRLQPDIARLLSAFVGAGVDLICTTQSEHLLLGLLGLVLEGELAADQVVVYYLREGEAERLVVDEQGRIEGGLRGFFEANEEQLRRHIELLKQRG